MFLVPELTQPVTLDQVQEEAQQSVGSGVPVPARCAQTPGHVRRPRRPKESAADRRQRRLRAEARTYSRLVRACRAAAGHHTPASRLVGCLRLYLQGNGSYQWDEVGKYPPVHVAKRADPAAMRAATTQPRRRPPTPPPPPPRLVATAQLVSPLVVPTGDRAVVQVVPNVPVDASCMAASSVLIPAYSLCASAVDVPSSSLPRKPVGAQASVIVVGNHDTGVASRGLQSPPPQRPPAVAKQLQHDTSLGIDLGSKTPVAPRCATWSLSAVGVAY